MLTLLFGYPDIHFLVPFFGLVPIYGTQCQCMRYIHFMSYTLFAVTKLPNNELTSIHTLSLPPLLL